MERRVITASMLHDYIRCDHRVTLDVHGDRSKRAEPNEFVELLWEGGLEHEDAVVSDLLSAIPSAVDLRSADDGTRLARTSEAMDARAPLIVGGEIAHDDLLGRPDLLSLEGDGYVPGDVKLGSSDEGRSEVPRLRYGVQVALYADVLGRLGRLARPAGYVIDGRGARSDFELSVRLATDGGTLLDRYEATLRAVRGVIARDVATLSVQAAECKLCRWYPVCKADVVARDDLTRIPQLGRSLRDRMIGALPTVASLAEADVAAFISGRKTIFPGLGPDRLRRFQDRAKLLTRSGAEAYARSPLRLPPRGRELLFDIETDPLNDHCYLNGVVERWTDGSGREPRYHAFISDGPADEAQAFVECLRFLEADPDAAVIYWSKYERTVYRALAAKHPHTDTAERVETLFSADRTVDLLYDVVAPHTDWPCSDLSVKTLAVHCGFAWRDSKPSGAASIRWYRDWQRTGDEDIKRRILEYNEDDNLAVGVVLDALRLLPVRKEGHEPD